MNGEGGGKKEREGEGEREKDIERKMRSVKRMRRDSVNVERIEINIKDILAGGR